MTYMILPTTETNSITQSGISLIIIIIKLNCLPPSRWGSHAQGILTIFIELTIDMNSVGPVIES